MTELTDEEIEEAKIALCQRMENVPNDTELWETMESARQKFQRVEVERSNQTTMLEKLNDE